MEPQPPTVLPPSADRWPPLFPHDCAARGTTDTHTLSPALFPTTCTRPLSSPPPRSSMANGTPIPATHTSVTAANFAQQSVVCFNFPLAQSVKNKLFWFLTSQIPMLLDQDAHRKGDPPGHSWAAPCAGHTHKCEGRPGLSLLTAACLCPSPRRRWGPRGKCSTFLLLWPPRMPGLQGCLLFIALPRPLVTCGPLWLGRLIK